MFQIYKDDELHQELDTEERAISKAMTISNLESYRRNPARTINVRDGSLVIRSFPVKVRGRRIA